MDDVCRRAATDAAKKEIARYKPFDDPVFMDLLELVVRKLEVNALEIDREFIHELDALYLFLDEQLDIRKLQKRLTGKTVPDGEGTCIVCNSVLKASMRL